MDLRTENAVKELVKKESREETALIQVNLRQMYAVIGNLQETLKELEEKLKSVRRSAGPPVCRSFDPTGRRADGLTGRRKEK